MEPTQNEVNDYQKGFNEGYLIAQHLPQLSDQLSRIDGDGMRLSGIREGHKQYLSERAREIVASKFQNGDLPSSSVEKDKTTEKDIEPEI